MLYLCSLTISFCSLFQCRTHSFRCRGSIFSSSIIYSVDHHHHHHHLVSLSAFLVCTAGKMYYADRLHVYHKGGSRDGRSKLICLIHALEFAKLSIKRPPIDFTLFLPLRQSSPIACYYVSDIDLSGAITTFVAMPCCAKSLTSVQLVSKTILRFVFVWFLIHYIILISFFLKGV